MREARIYRRRGLVRFKVEYDAGGMETYTHHFFLWGARWAAKRWTRAEEPAVFVEKHPVAGP